MAGRAVSHLTAHDPTAPARSPAAARRDACLSRQHVPPTARRASPIARCGITCFSEPTRKRAWAPLTVVRAPREQQLPVLLRVAEGRTLLAPLQRLRSRACLTPLDPCGLRRHEGPPLAGPRA